MKILMIALMLSSAYAKYIPPASVQITPPANNEPVRMDQHMQGVASDREGMHLI